MGLGSVLLGASDRVYPYLLKLPACRFFKNGFGDLTQLEEAMCFSRRWRQRDGVAESSNAVVVNGPLTPGSTVSGVFPSPFAAFLPAESHQVSFIVVMPPVAPPKAIVLLLPGTADQSYLWRRIMFAQPLAQADVASILITAPLYSERRPAGQLLHFVDTVERFILQSCALQAESLVLLEWAQRTFPGVSLACSGISWGASVAATVGMLWEGPIAIAPLCGSATADAFTEGALVSDVAWDALAADTGGDHAKARQRLEDVFDVFSFVTLARGWRQAASVGDGKMRSIAGQHKVVVAAGAAHDGFVPLERTTCLVELMREFLPRTTLVCIPGGHTSAHILARWLLAKLILQSIDKLRGTRMDVHHSIRSRL
jgi:hypothetical protein